VVAAEVRKLAQRSAVAAKEIGGLIRSNIENAREGSGLVEETAETLAEMAGDIQDRAIKQEYGAWSQGLGFFNSNSSGNSHSP